MTPGQFRRGPSTGLGLGLCHRSLELRLLDFPLREERSRGDNRFFNVVWGDGHRLPIHWA